MQKNPKKPLNRFLNALYNLSNSQQYLILLSISMVQILYSVLLFVYLKLYFLVGISLLGGAFFCLMYKLSYHQNFKMIFYAIITYAYIIELSSAFFLEWDMRFQNFLLVLIPLSFTFQYLNDNYEELLPNGILSSAMVIFCYLMCSFIDYKINPISGASTFEIRIISDIGTLLIIVMLFVYAVLFIVELYRTHQQLLSETNTHIEGLRSSMMLSQIKPHFLYNTMGAIEELIGTDPERAKREIQCFATYMRTNIDTLSSNELVSFKKELSHVKAFMQIQKLRFEDTVTIEYHITCENFKLPPLTIQPIVENALKHGIRPKDVNGTIKIYTEENKDSYLIIVIDDGVGIDLKKSIPSSSSTGLANIRYRLKELCNGQLKIISKPGFGTTVTVILPKNKQEVIQCERFL